MAVFDYDLGILGGGAAGLTASAGAAQFGAKTILRGVDPRVGPAINGGVKLSTMAGAIHAYPTLSEISKKAAGSYYSEKLFSDRTKKILRFLFDLKGRACTPEGEIAG